MSHQSNHNTHSACKQCLLDQGAGISAGHVVYACRLGRDHQMGAPILSNEILRYVVHHRRLPRVSKLLHLRRRHGKRSAAVWFLEADARSETPMRQLFNLVDGPCPGRPIRWLGWYQWHKGWRYFWPHGARRVVQLQSALSVHCLQKAKPFNKCTRDLCRPAGTPTGILRSGAVFCVT